MTKFGNWKFNSHVCRFLSSNRNVDFYFLYMFVLLNQPALKQKLSLLEHLWFESGIVILGAPDKERTHELNISSGQHHSYHFSWRHPGFCNSCMSISGGQRTGRGWGGGCFTLEDTGPWWASKGGKSWGIQSVPIKLEQKDVSCKTL